MVVVVPGTSQQARKAGHHQMLLAVPQLELAEWPGEEPREAAKGGQFPAATPWMKPYNVRPPR